MREREKERAQDETVKIGRKQRERMRAKIGLEEGGKVGLWKFVPVIVK